MMPDTRFPCQEIDGTVVVATPAEVDITSAAELYAVLLDAISRGRATAVLDLTCARFCDSAAMNAMIRTHRRARAEGGELRLVVPADGQVPRSFALVCIDMAIPCFSSVTDALAATPSAQVISLAAYRHRRSR